MKVSVQHEDFDIAEECAALRARSRETGAIATFTGLVRELHGEQAIDALELEHYPGMTEKSLHGILDEASARWPLIDATIIHRTGRLAVSEQIVLVAVSSAHRQAAFDACNFVMDYLKTRAPFWKKTVVGNDGEWVDAKQADQSALQKWE